MPIYSLPTEEKRFMQPNNGDVFGNLWATYGVDLTTNKGRLRSSANILKAISTTDDAQLSGYAANFAIYDGKLWALSDNPFRVTTTDVTGTWIQDSDTGSPTPGNTVTDMVVFDGILLAVDGDDIHRNPGDGDWDSWWRGLRSQSALTIGERFFMKTVEGGTLFLTSGGNKVYRVEPNGSGTGTITTSGAGTLDFSYQPYTFTCMEINSTRMWIGFENTAGGNGGVIEWDMVGTSTEANRVHYLDTSAVRCVAIWNDMPIAVLANGDVKRFNGSQFVDFTGIQFPSANTDFKLDTDFIHNNGWAIIDGLPHFLVMGRDATQSGGLAKSINSEINFPSGIWCLDPEIGLYHRYPLGAGTSTQLDYGVPSLKAVGALIALDDPNTKFFCSYEYYDTDGSTVLSVIAYADNDRSKAGRSWFITTPANITNVAKTVQATHKTLSSGDQLRFYYRQNRSEGVVLSGTWSSQTEFHTTNTATSVSVGDVLFIKTGSGAGSIHRITNKTASTSVTVLTIDEANALITAGDTGGVECLNFTYMGKVTDTVLDWNKLDIPSQKKSRSVQLLVELRQAASSTVELDNVIIE